MKNAELEPYFGIHHGHQAWLKDMHEISHPAALQLIKDGEAEAQLPLPGFRPEGDMLVIMPKKVTQRLSWEQQQIEAYEVRIRKSRRIP